MRVFTALLAGIVALPVPAGASDVSRELDEVVVTASRVSEKKKEAAVTVDVISRKEMETVKYRNPAEALRRVPGVFTHNFGGQEELTSIRIPTHFTNPYTLLLVDGLPATSYGEPAGGLLREVNNGNIERIEVVKGPASALYGSNAIGGIINVITKEPSAVPEATGSAELGVYSQKRLHLAGSGTGELLGFNVSADLADNEEWREHGDNEKKAGDLKLKYALTDSSTLTFKCDFINFDNDLPGSIDKTDFETDWQKSYQTFTNVAMEKIAPALVYSLDLWQGELKASLVVRNVDHEVFPNYGMKPVPRDATGTRFTNVFHDVNSTDADLELLYSREFAPRRTVLVAGVDFEQGESDTDTFALAITRDAASRKFTSYTETGLDSSFDITTRVAAPYLNAETSLTDAIRISAGGRYDMVGYEVEDRLGLGDGGDFDFSRFTPKAGASYLFSERLTVYTSYSQGFVVPNTSQLFTSSQASRDLDAEKAENFELGLRSSWWEDKLALDLALYAMTVEDKIISQATGTYTSVYVNAGETSHRGAELTAELHPFEPVSLTLAYAYARSKYEDFRDPGKGLDFSGNWMPRAPEHHLSARFTLTPVPGLTTELEMDLVSKQYAGDDNINTYCRPALFHLRTSYDRDEWSFWVHLLNLTNQEHATYVSDNYGSLQYFPGSPFSAFAGISYRWEI